MALFDFLTRAARGDALPGGVLAAPGLESPNATSTAAQVVWAEYFVGEAGEVTRESALQIPAVKKARDTLLGIIAGCQLREYDVATGAETTPAWLTSTSTQISPWHRIAYVFDDLFFYDWSALAVKRDGTGPTAQIVDALRIPWKKWEMREDGTVVVDWKPAEARDVVLIPGNGSGGILAAGAPTIKGARALERAWIGRAQNPIPLIELHQLTDEDLTDGSDDEADDEVGDLLATWAAARTSPTGAVGFTDNRVEVRVHGNVQTDLFETGRNAIVLDIARLTGVPASILDGSQSTASLTYSTADGKRSEFDDYALPMWMDPIAARLSMDDVSPAGRVIRFDLSGRRAPAAPTTTGPTEE